jgi:hypothetical protein
MEIKKMEKDLSLSKYLVILTVYIPAVIIAYFMGSALSAQTANFDRLANIQKQIAETQDPTIIMQLQGQFIQEMQSVYAFLGNLIALLALTLVLTFGIDPFVRAVMFKSAGGAMNLKRDIPYAKERYWSMVGGTALQFIIYAIPFSFVLLVSLAFNASIFVHNILSSVVLGTVNVFLYFTNPLIVLKKRNPGQAVRESVRMFLQRKMEVLTVFLSLTFSGIVITYLLQVLVFRIDPYLSPSIIGGSPMIGYATASVSVIIVEALISSIFDYLHITARAEILKEKA